MPWEIWTLTNLGAIFGVFLLLHTLTNLKFYVRALRIPSYVSVPVLGDLFMIVYYKLDVIKVFNLLNKHPGGCFRVCGRRMMVLLQEPEYLETLFTHPDLQNKGLVYDGLRELIGDTSLFVIDSDEARASRKTFVKTFNNSSHQLIVNNFYKTADNLNNRLKSLSGGDYFPVGELIKNATAASFFRTILEIELLDYPHLEKGVADFEKYAFLVVARGSSPFHQNNFIFNNLMGGHKLQQFVHHLDKSIQEIVDKKRVVLGELQSTGETIPNQFIFNILQERVGAADELIRTEIKTLIAAALDTTFLAISFTLLMLGMRPDIQENVRLEDEMIQKELAGRQMVEGDFNKYVYLGRVFKETMRLYPPVPLAPREARDDVRIGKYIIPKGVSVVGVSLAVHRDPQIYENPLQFDPNRFNHDNINKRHKYAYCPFSGGQRSCPGLRYGTQSAIFFVSSIVRKFKIHTKYESISKMDENLEFILSLYDKAGFEIRLEER